MAWKHQDTKDVLSILRKFRIGSVEVAPTIVSGDWDTPFDYPYPISSFQSILYNTDIRIYEDPDAFVSHYRKVAKLCSTHGVRSVVFGSPNQRHVSTGVDIVPYFKTIADISREYSVAFCIEPNSKKYGCTWLTTVSEVVDFLQKVDESDVIKLNLDTGNYIMEDDTFVFDADSVKYIGNVQVSNEHLEPLCDMTEENKATTARVLKNIASVGYAGYISLEMKTCTIAKLYRSLLDFVEMTVLDK
jgi:sugar phosphate isomerase/epimerase